MGTEFHPHLGLAEMVRLARREEAEAPGLPRLRLGILSNYSTQFLAMALRLSLRNRGFDAIIRDAGYNQWEPALMDPEAALGAFRPDVVLLTLTSALLQVRREAVHTEAFSERVAALVSRASQRLGARFVVTLPEPLEEELEQTGWAFGWRRRLVRDLRERLEGIATLVEMEPLLVELGAAAWFSPRFLVNQKLPANPQTSAYHGDYLARTIAAVVQRRVKLVVVDLDNTLWGGIVGEVGWDGVNLDAEQEGWAYLRLQRFLLGLHERGVLLAVCSKNNRQDAMDVFQRRPEMLLREDHFADLRINWEPKSSNIRATLQSLNLTPTGVVFIDDSPFERGEVSTALPEVYVPSFPPDIIDLVSELSKSGLFTIPVVNAEDLVRNEQYVQERQRQTVAATAVSLDDYHRSLELVLVPRRLDESGVDRAVDLLAKTNQFNLTTRRYGRADIQRLQAEPGTEIWTYSLNDRFGAYGTIAVVITKVDGADLVVDTWLMSCRAMGRTVERGIFAHILERARSAGKPRIVAEYIKSQKNAPVEDLYPRLGFASVDTSGDSKWFAYADDGTEPTNEFVRILDPESEESPGE